MLGVAKEVTDQELVKDFDEKTFAEALSLEINSIDMGNQHASKFHKFITGVLEFIFYPHLIYPVMEQEIHEGRKRIDIAFTNNSDGGFFFNRRSEAKCNASRIFVECKNYSKEIANPELDQLAGRFSPIRGRLGLLIGRNFDNRERFIARCRDTARDDRGFIIPLVDEDIIRLLNMIRDGQRVAINVYMEQRFNELLG